MEAEFFYAEPLVERDAQDIMAAILELSPTREVSLESVRLSAENEHMFVVRNDEGRICAVGTLVPIFLTGRYCGIVHDVVVRKASQGLGLGTVLMKKVLWYAEMTGMKHLDLTTAPGKNVAHHLYEKLGFKKRDTDLYRLCF